MIGPTSSFYSPQDSAHAQYQQWLDAIESQSQHTQAVSQVPMYGALPRPQQTHSIFDLPQGHYPTTSPMNQYIGSSTIAQSNVSNLDPANETYQNQADIFQPFFDLRSIAADPSSSPEQGQAYNTSTSDSTLQSFGTTPPQQNARPLFTYPQQPQIQPQAKQHPQSSRSLHPPRSLLPRPGRPKQQKSNRQSPPQFKQTSSQTRFAVQPQQAHAISSQSNLSTSHPSSSSGPQPGAPWTTGQQHSGPSAVSSTGGFYHVSATTFAKHGPATGSQKMAGSTTQGSESSWNSEKKRKRSRKEGTQESSTVSEGDSDDDEFAGGISVGMGGIGVAAKGESTSRL